MQQCLYCHKELDAKAETCPHCGKSYPIGRPFFSHPVIIVAWLACSAEGIWLSHSFTKLRSLPGRLGDVSHYGQLWDL
jgi:hypothetical protein